MKEINIRGDLTNRSAKLKSLVIPHMHQSSLLVTMPAVQTSNVAWPRCMTLKFAVLFKFYDATSVLIGLTVPGVSVICCLVVTESLPRCRHRHVNCQGTFLDTIGHGVPWNIKPQLFHLHHCQCFLLSRNIG